MGGREDRGGGVQRRIQVLGGGGGGGTDGGCGWGGCGRGVPLPPQLGGMGERCKLPHRGLGLRPRSFAILLYSNHETR